MSESLPPPSEPPKMRCMPLYPSRYARDLPYADSFVQIWTEYTSYIRHTLGIQRAQPLPYIYGVKEAYRGGGFCSKRGVTPWPGLPGSRWLQFPIDEGWGDAGDDIEHRAHANGSGPHHGLINQCGHTRGLGGGHPNFTYVLRNISWLRVRLCPASSAYVIFNLGKNLGFSPRAASSTTPQTEAGARRRLHPRRAWQGILGWKIREIILRGASVGRAEVAPTGEFSACDAPPTASIRYTDKG